jgi:choline dehydrogenase
VLPAFRRLERDLDYPGDWHGDRGPIPVRRYHEDRLHPVQRAFMDAAAGLRLDPADPWAPPLIDPSLLRHPGDLPRLREGVALARRLATTAPLADHLDGAPAPDLPELVVPYQHPVGTCRMGPATDPHAVVDQAGRVHELEGLVVCDASVMPAIPSANTHLPTSMVAERCAEWLG